MSEHVTKIQDMLRKRSVSLRAHPCPMEPGRVNRGEQVVASFFGNKAHMASLGGLLVGSSHSGTKLVPKIQPQLR